MLGEDDKWVSVRSRWLCCAGVPYVGGGLQCVPGPRCLYALIPEGMGESEAFMSCLGRLASYVVYLAI